MKALLRERLLARRPVMVTKEQYVADWNRQHNVWAPIDCAGYACDACQGAAVRAERSCERCGSTGYVDIKTVHVAYRTHKAMATFRMGQAKLEEARFERFLKAVSIDDLELVHDLLLYPPPRRFENPAEKKVKPKLVRRIHKKTGAIARRPEELAKKAAKSPPKVPTKPQVKKSRGPKPATKISSGKRKTKSAAARRAAH